MLTIKADAATLGQWTVRAVMGHEAQRKQEAPYLFIEIGDFKGAL